MRSGVFATVTSEYVFCWHGPHISGQSGQMATGMRTRRCPGSQFSVGAGVGGSVGCGVGDAVGLGVGAGVGDAVGVGVGEAVGLGVGWTAASTHVTSAVGLAGAYDVLPISHGTQLLSVLPPLAAEVLPAVHAVHEGDPDFVAKRPRGQALHDSWPSSSWNSPAMHWNRNEYMQ